jgi:hypothetical protein
MYNKVRALYELFYRGLYNQRSYIYTPSESAEKNIHNFIKLLDKKYTLESIGDNFLATYFIFQFAYWSELDLTAYNKNIVISYIIGPKAFKRWVERDIEYDYTIDLIQVKKTNVTRGEAIRLISEVNEIRQDTLKHEEREKIRFVKTDRQFTHCIENTTLYNPRSLHCLICKDKADCILLLEKRFPQIFFHRFNKNK